MLRTLIAGTIAAGLLLGGPVTLLAQEPSEAAAQARRHFEAGEYQQVLDAADPAAAPAVVFTAVLSQEKLGATEQAAALAQRLRELPEENPWQAIGASMAELLADQSDAALVSADRAVAAADALPEAHYQRGLVLAKRQDWAQAAAAFDRVTALSPSYAYAYYYAGLMHYRANRPDLMAVRFERFLKLAPQAPERPEVVQIMRTIRGR